MTHDPASPNAPLPLSVLDRVLAGTPNPRDAEQVTEWLAGASARADLLAELQGQELDDRSQRYPDADAALEALTRRIDTLSTLPSTPPRRQKEHGRSLLRRGMLFAGGVGLCGLAILGLRLAPGWAPWRTQLSSKPSTQTYVTRTAQLATITLRDGARVILGPATRLEIAGGTPSTGTTAIVNGQALFIVSHHTGAPFVVQAGHSRIHVLGTTFVVRRYASDSVTQIVVTDGRVAVATQHHPKSVDASQAVLTPGTLGIVSDSGEIRVVSHVETAVYTGWASGTLVFKETPVHDVIESFNRAYGVDLQVADSMLMRRRITWTIETRQYAAADALHDLLIILDAHVVPSGHSLVLARGRAASPKASFPQHSLTEESQYGR